jgi:uncharacterized lipoprotein
MKLLPMVLVLVLAVSAASAAEPVAQTFNTSPERAWTTLEAVLKQLGWDVDRKDRTIGMLTTQSRRLEGEDYGVYAKGTRHRLTVHVKGASQNRTTVTIEREVFKRERILWIDKDEPLKATGNEVERAVLASIAKAL